MDAAIGEPKVTSSGMAAAEEKVVVETGSAVGTVSVADHPGVGIDGKHIVTYYEAILSETLPEKVVIVGAGPIGIEFAYVWKNYGVDVTVVEMLPHLLPNEDPEVSQVLEKAYKKLGITFYTGTLVEKVEANDQGVRVQLNNGEVLEADQVMIAIGFQPNIENIGLENPCLVLALRGITIICS